MSSGTELIEEALQGIGAQSILSPASPESIELGKNKLNSMLQQWLSEGIEMGITPIDQAGDEVSEPLDARGAIVDNLSIMLAPSFSSGKNIVSPSLRTNALDGYYTIKRLYTVVTISTKVISSTTPVGAGNIQNDGFGHRRFKGVGGTVGN